MLKINLLTPEWSQLHPWTGMPSTLLTNPNNSDNYKNVFFFWHFCSKIWSRKYSQVKLFGGINNIRPLTAELQRRLILWVKLGQSSSSETNRSSLCIHTKFKFRKFADEKVAMGQSRMLQSSCLCNKAQLQCIGARWIFANICKWPLGTIDTPFRSIGTFDNILKKKKMVESRSNLITL